MRHGIRRRIAVRRRVCLVDHPISEEDQPVTTPAPGSPVSAAPITAAPQGAAPPLPVPTTTAKRTGWVAWVITLAVLMVIYLAFFYGIFLGNTPAFFAAVAALIPLGIVIFTVIRVD